MLINTEGLILREVNIAERDKMLTVLTRDYGKISAVARGARSIKSKKLAATQLFSFSRLAVERRGDRATITQAETIEAFYNLRLSISKMSLACYMAELCEYCSDERLGGELLSLMLNCLYMLSKKDEGDERLIKAVFELRAMTLLGHMPDLECCFECGRDEGPFLFLIDGGRIVCPDHDGGQLEGKKAPLPPAVLGAMRYISSCDGRRIFSFSLLEPQIETLSHISELYTLSQMERDFRTLKYYRNIIKDI